MAVSKKRKSATSKKVTRKTTRQTGAVAPVKLFSWFLILALLFSSLVVLVYVIFFRTVAAHAMSQDSTPCEIQMDEEVPRLPTVAIIIDDMGYHHHEGRLLLDLPYALSFAFLPYATSTDELIEAAHERNKTILLHQPMQPKGQEWNPGRGALTMEHSPEQIEKIIEKNLQHVPYAVGVNNHMGSYLTELEEPMEVVLDYISRQGLFFIDSYTTAKSIGYKLALKMGVKTGRRNVFLDNVHDVDKICCQLESLVKYAEKHGSSIGIGHPYPETYEALKKCLPRYDSRVDIVGVEQLIH